MGEDAVRSGCVAGWQRSEARNRSPAIQHTLFVTALLRRLRRRPAPRVGVAPQSMESWLDRAIAALCTDRSTGLPRSVRQPQAGPGARAAGDAPRGCTGCVMQAGPLVAFRGSAGTTRRATSTPRVRQTRGAAVVYSLLGHLTFINSKPPLFCEKGIWRDTLGPTGDG
jgi:hypothetical protein